MEGLGVGWGGRLVGAGDGGDRPPAPASTPATSTPPASPVSPFPLLQLTALEDVGVTTAELEAYLSAEPELPFAHGELPAVPRARAPAPAPSFEAIGEARRNGVWGGGRAEAGLAAGLAAGPGRPPSPRARPPLRSAAPSSNPHPPIFRPDAAATRACLPACLS